MRTTITDHDRYTEMAREAIDATRDPLMIRWNDEEMGATRVAILGGEHQDPLHRSNLETALKILSDHVEDGTVEDGIVSRSGATWLTFLSVQALDEDGGVTQAWIDTVDEILDPLEISPVLDEERYSELEYDELIETVQYAAGDEGLAEILLGRLEFSNPEEYDHDREIEALARDVVIGETVIADEDAREALASNARQTARHLRFDAERRHRSARLRARAIVLETIAEGLDPEDEETPRPYCA